MAEHLDDNDVDQQFRALMEGLRTSLPGVQVLFAFLLTAPLQNGFDDFTALQQSTFAVAFYSSAAASLLLISPSVHQRLRAPRTGLRRHSKQHLIVTTWVTIAGTAFMAAAIVATVLLVSSLAFGRTAALISSAVALVVVGWIWVYLPLVSFTSEEQPREEQHRAS